MRCAHVLSRNIAAETGEDVAPEDVLIDAPPVKREIEVKIDVYFLKEDHYRSLSDVSPVVHTLARELSAQLDLAQEALHEDSHD